MHAARAKAFGIIGLVMCAFIGLTACEPQLDHGTITNLTYDPDESYWETNLSCDAKGKCTSTMDYVSIPECYHVWFQEDGKRGDDCVTRRDWQSLKVGMYFDERR